MGFSLHSTHPAAFAPCVRTDGELAAGLKAFRVADSSPHPDMCGFGWAMGTTAWMQEVEQPGAVAEAIRVPRSAWMCERGVYRSDVLRELFGHWLLAVTQIAVHGAQHARLLPSQRGDPDNGHQHCQHD